MFPLAFGIIRDEFPRERVAGGIALIRACSESAADWDRPRRADPRQPQLPLALLDPVPSSLQQRSPPCSSFPSRRSGPRARSIGGRRTSFLLARLPVAGDQSGAAVGMDIGENDRAAGGRGGGWYRVGRHRGGTASALVDMQMMRLRPVWSTNLAGFLIGFGLFSSFVLIPQFVQTPPSNGYGFGSSVTQSGLFLDPVDPDDADRRSLQRQALQEYGSKVPLVFGSALTMLAFVVLAVAHSSQWQFYAASALLGIGVGFAFARSPTCRGGGED